MIIVKNKNAKTIEEVQANIDDIARQAVSRETVSSVETVSGSVSNTWGASDAEKVNDLINKFNTLVENMRNQ